MDYETVRLMVNKAVMIVDRRLCSDEEEDANCWCQLDRLEFDQTFCEDRDDHDDSLVSIKVTYLTADVHKEYPNGTDVEITLMENDLISPSFIAGLLYAKILAKSGIL